MKKDFNSPILWNKLLSNSEYLSEEGISAVKRCNLTINQIKKNKSKKILNIGSGQGFLERIFFKRNNSEIDWISSDISKSGLDRLKKYPINRVLAYAHELPFKSNTFDCCICMEVLEHVSKPMLREVFKEFDRVLDKKGILLVSVPVYEPISLMNHPVGHLRKFTINEIVNDVNNAGFQINSIKYLYAFNKNYLIKSTLSKLLKIRRPANVYLVCRKK